MYRTKLGKCKKSKRGGFLALSVCVSTFNPLAHFSSEHPPEKRYSRYEELIYFRSPGFENDDGVACENERCNSEDKPEILYDFIGFLHLIRSCYRLRVFHRMVVKFGIV
jgi:hypothetical protein